MEILHTIADWLGAGRYSAHSLCLTNDPIMIWIFSTGDLVTGTSYFIMGLTFIVYRARIISMSPVARGLYGAFIFLCGAEHYAKSLTLFAGVYRLEAITTAAMAAVSAVTAALTVRQIGEWTRHGRASE